MIIGICGFIGSGKDTLANYFVQEHGFARSSYAETLKDSVAAVFGWDRDMLEGNTNESRQWREQVDEWWADRLEMPHLTPRWVLQYWGTDVCRHNLHNDIWIASLENKLLNTNQNTVISDCRFPNEVSSIKKQNGIMIQVKRGEDPEWLEYAQDYLKGMHHIGWANGKHWLNELDVHPSEYSWVNTDFDCIVDNNGSVDDLYRQAEDIVSKYLAPNHQVAMASLA